MQPGEDRVALRGRRSQPVHPPPRLRIQPSSARLHITVTHRHRHGRPQHGRGPGQPREMRGEQSPGRAGEQRQERRAAPGSQWVARRPAPTRDTSPAPPRARVTGPAAPRCPARMHDPHVSDRRWPTGWFRPVISSMPGLPPPGAPGCSPTATRRGSYGRAGSSDSAPTAPTSSRTSPSVSMRLISPYSSAVSAPPVRNQVPAGASHSSTSSNSARTRSLATPRILTSYTRGRIATSPALPCVGAQAAPVQSQMMAVPRPTWPRPAARFGGPAPADLRLAGGVRSSVARSWLRGWARPMAECVPGGWQPYRQPDQSADRVPGASPPHRGQVPGGAAVVDLEPAVGSDHHPDEQAGRGEGQERNADDERLGGQEAEGDDEPED